MALPLCRIEGLLNVWCWSFFPPVLTDDWHHFCPNCTILIGVPSEELIKHLEGVCRAHAHRDLMWQLSKKCIDRQCQNSLCFQLLCHWAGGAGVGVDIQNCCWLNMVPLWKWLLGRVIKLGPLDPMAQPRHLHQDTYKQALSFARVFALYPGTLCCWWWWYWCWWFGFLSRVNLSSPHCWWGCLSLHLIPLAQHLNLSGQPTSHVAQGLQHVWCTSNINIHEHPTI